MEREEPEVPLSLLYPHRGDGQLREEHVPLQVPAPGIPRQVGAQAGRPRLHPRHRQQRPADEGLFGDAGRRERQRRDYLPGRRQRAVRPRAGSIRRHVQR